MRVIEEVRMKEESGAVLVIVALLLVALFGMVALAVDIGGVAAKARGLVNASDSGALGAAISFAKREAQCGTDEAPAQLTSDRLATANVAGAVRIGWQTDCGARRVRVEYQDVQRFFFAQVLGLSDRAQVRRPAAAIWGPAGAASGVAPVVNYLSTFQGTCDIGNPNVEIGTPCYMWWDNDLFEGSAFGFMNLDQWNVPADFNCSDSGAANRNGWIANGYPQELALNYPAPTYVCRDSGLTGSNWMTLESQEGQIKWFPVNDQATMIWKQGQVDKYNIIGFMALRIEDVLTVQEAGGQNGRCNVRDRTFSTGSSLNLLAICPTGTDPNKTQISGLTITSGQGNNQITYQQGTNYTYDASTHTVTWITPSPVTVDLRYDWAEGGQCGVPPANNSSARCMIVSWQGYQTGGSRPGGGADLGGALQAVRLVE